MLGSFKIRMLIVIIVVFLAGFSMESGHSSKQMVESTIKYILKDYGFNAKISLFWENIRPPRRNESMPASSSAILQIPCKFSAIERNYGWYYDQQSQQQEFLPGIYLGVEDNTMVKPIMAGYIEEIGQNDEGRTILIKHDSDFYSSYGGLREILVEKGGLVDNNTVLGKTGKLLYLEIRNSDGPVNPYNLINANS